jgi:hypothetical protein
VSFKYLTAENWLHPDEAGRAFGEVNLRTGETLPASAERWAERFLAVELSPKVPSDVRDMWVIARGVLLYGWFFYTLYALGDEQLHRVADAAVLYRYEQADGPRDSRTGRLPNLKPRLDWLIAQGIIDSKVDQRWDAIRNLRNYGSHATFARIDTPIGALQTLEVLAEETTLSFRDRPPRPTALFGPLVA